MAEVAAAPAPRVQVADADTDTAVLEAQRLLLREEIAAVRRAVDAFKNGTTPPLDRQVPYVARVARLLRGQTACRVKVCGDGGAWETSVQSDGDTKQALLARLAVYLLLTKGKFTKVKKESKINLDRDSVKESSEPFFMQTEKALSLETYKEKSVVTQFRALTCNVDPDWTLRVLQVVAPQIEELRISHVEPAHLHVLGLMPRLRRAEVWLSSDNVVLDDLGPFRWAEDSQDKGFSFDLKDPTKTWTFPEVPLSHAGVVWLKIDLPRHVALPLIAQHRRTLRELLLTAAVPTEDESEVPEWEFQRQWAWYCKDLPERMGELVERYRFESLRLVELCRLSKCARYGDCGRCQQQLRGVRKALARTLGPTVVVRCNSCG